MLFHFDENRQPRLQITLMSYPFDQRNVAYAISVDSLSLHNLEASGRNTRCNSCIFSSFALGTGNAFPWRIPCAAVKQDVNWNI